MELDEQQAEERMSQLRELWCAWDPLGVLHDPDWPRSEYDDYLDPTLDLLDRGGSEQDLEEYLRAATEFTMGLEAGVATTKMFASMVISWYDAEWRGAEKRPSHESEPA